MVRTCEIYSPATPKYSTDNYNLCAGHLILRTYSSCNWGFVPFDQHLSFFAALATTILFPVSPCSAFLDSTDKWCYSAFVFDIQAYCRFHSQIRFVPWSLQFCLVLWTCFLDIRGLVSIFFSFFTLTENYRRLSQSLPIPSLGPVSVIASENHSL